MINASEAQQKQPTKAMKRLKPGTETATKPVAATTTMRTSLNRNHLHAAPRHL